MAAASVPPRLAGHGLGNRRAFERDRLGFLLHQRQYGDLVPVDDTLCVVNTPALVEQVLRNTNGTYSITRDLLGEEIDGSRASEGLAQWMRARHLAGRGVNRSGLRAAGDHLAAVVARHAEAWREAGDIDAIIALEDLSVRLITEFCLGPDPGQVPMLVARFQDTRLPGRVPWPGWAPDLRRRRLHRVERELAAETSRLIEARRRRPGGSASVVADLLNDACDQGALTHQGAVSVVVSTLFAAHETTAAALAWLLLLLDRHPHVRRQVVDEVDRELDGRLPTASDLPRLAVIGAVVKETLRLYPPLWYLERTVAEPTELGGHRLHPGQRVALSPFALHRDARLYDQPSTFRPARWTDRPASTRLPAYAYLPFGGGPRMCLGAHFATVAMTIATAILTSRYQVTQSADCTPTFDTRTILQPRGLMLNVTDRAPLRAQHLPAET
ncbi:cytochrome P450 [Streptomyces camelliae]|uniref:Cytochrome P450 n=1 Tax=Streptomyces camelliae TaxID=3004093 RepID=A0ABY7NUG9_9ACTN|nr:cytochrome P450 [Streptomyces sp. HUAS 2-6]WBO61439.1 cytochrome P450 [Streptomyces sp. HUAS 2-6]